MSTVKFDLQDELNSFQARIYLDTKHKMSKKEVLELVFKVGSSNYDQILQQVRNMDQDDLSDEIIERIAGMGIDFGDGTERLSTEIDRILYGSQHGAEE